MFFVKEIISWYLIHQRDLPWRRTKEPFKIWLSEIILQQTRVDQGFSYYQRFVERFPTVEALANASEDEILKSWQGLGYYSRARNLHRTAKLICEKFDGKFPDNYGDILQLKGVGKYTAAAISSFAFNLPYAVVDGNVYRLLGRFFDIDIAIDTTNGKKYFEKLANELLPQAHPSLYNQAIMEFGALQCVPKNPDCEICPLKMECKAYQSHTIALRPVKSKKIQIRERFFYYFVFVNQGKIVIKKRNGNDIWKGLYDFPLIETESRIDESSFLDTFGINFNQITALVTLRHILTHQRLNITILRLNFLPDNIIGNECESISLVQLSQRAFPKPLADYLQKNLFGRK